ncbi:50S ribosomal protein L7/L12 [Candidatus Microgenomates bacterium]|nr:MAG: 50S ribosomal protein L7/L12 [Candidatus Microgenomates bacterium]
MAAEETKKSKAVEKLVEEVSKLTVLELSELVTALQDTLGVSAMPVAAAATPAAAETTEAGGAAASATQTLMMTGAGDNKIAVIKALREVNQNWGLKEAKDMTENLPAEILKDAKAEEVKEAAEKLKAAGATVEIK